MFASMGSMTWASNYWRLHHQEWCWCCQFLLPSDVQRGLYQVYIYIYYHIPIYTQYIRIYRHMHICSYVLCTVYWEFYIYKYSSLFPESTVPIHILESWLTVDTGQRSCRPSANSAHIAGGSRGRSWGLHGQLRWFSHEKWWASHGKWAGSLLVLV